MGYGHAMKRFALVALVAVALATPTSVATAATSTTKFKNCTALRKKYPKGVAKTRSAAKRTGAKYNPKVYNANKKMDRDKDSVACEVKG